MDRTILHIDCNRFFASVECLHRPEIRDLPVAVGGDSEKRHGIILTANYNASKYGISTAEPIWQAKNKCPDLVIVPPNYPLYIRFSNLARKIYADYTDRVEPFGLDECWLDITDNTKEKSDGLRIANEIRERVKDELGITVSIGVSWNKVFSKLGSDYKKPDAVTLFTRENYKDLVYPLPVENLLYIGKATKRKLNSRGIFTIGDLAESKPQNIASFLGKNGLMLSDFAQGLECSAVSKISDIRAVKSIGNSVTTPRDLVNFEDIKLTLTVLADSVSRRLREQGFLCQNIGISVRDASLHSFTRQMVLDNPISSSHSLINYSMKLVYESLSLPFNIRSIGICVGELCTTQKSVQFDIFGKAVREEKERIIENTVDNLKVRFGSKCVQRACLLKEKNLTDFSPYDEHTVHPEGWFR